MEKIETKIATVMPLKKCPHRSYGNGDSTSPSSCVNPNLPKTLPIVGLGCSSFSTAFFHDPEKIDPPLTNPPSRDHPLVIKWIETIHHAILNCGITLLDTAPWYGHGISEKVIGFALEDLLQSDTRTDIRRADLVINTKVGRYDADPIQDMFDFSARRVRSSVLTSMERMKCSYIDVLQLHDPEFAPSLDLLIDETIPAMIKLRDEEKAVRAIGMTGYSLAVQQELIHRTFEKYGVYFDQSLTYCHYTLFDQSLFHRQWPRPDGFTTGETHPPSSSSSFANYCKASNVGVLAAAPLGMGLLTQESNPPAWHPASAALKDACKSAANYCDKMNVSLATMAMLFALGQEKIACTILGMKDIEEVNRAMTVARRFVCTANTEDNHQDRTKLLSLPHVLTEVEKQVLNHLLDLENDGPYSQVAKLGDFQWEGVEVANFWKLNPYSRVEAERRMRV